jgi:hypothetical protein
MIKDDECDPAVFDSPLVRELKNRERETWSFDAVNLAGAGDKPLGKYRIWVATKFEQDQAIVQAHKYAKAMAGEDRDAAEDKDLLDEAKTAHILAATCRNHEQPKGLPAFPGPKWMMQHMSTDELSVLLHNYNACLGKCGVYEMDTSEEKVDFYLQACADTGETDLPDMLLGQCHREYLIFLLVRAASRMKRAEAKLEKADIGERFTFEPMGEIAGAATGAPSDDDDV